MLHYFLPLFMMEITEKVKELDIYTIFFLLFLIFITEQVCTKYNLKVMNFLWDGKKRFKYNVVMYGIKTYDKYANKNEKYSISATPGFVSLNNYLMYQLRLGNLSNLRNIKEIIYNSYDTPKSNGLTFQIDTHSIVCIRNEKDWSDIYFQMCEYQIDGEKPNSTNEMVRLELKVMSNRHCTDTLMKKCESLYQKEEDLKNGTTTTNLFLCRYQGVHDDRSSFEITSFHTNCSMDSLLFEEKYNILQYVDFFEKEQDWYKVHGRPYTLGICTYGPPGCGKTSFEKALAVYLNRHLIVVDFDKLQSEDELIKLFFDEKIGPYHIPNNKRLYVFPDIDKTTTILYKEKYVNKSMTNHVSMKTMEKIIDSIHHHQETEEKKKEKRFLQKELNLSQILNVMDGLMERTGQIFIMSANHPEKLDPALIRHGRVDCMVHFREFPINLLVEYIDNFFQTTSFLPPTFVEKHNVELNRKFSPCKLFDLCVKSDGNSDKLQKFLLES